MYPPLTPPPLRPGDLVAIVCPASAVKPQYLEDAARVLEGMGLRAEIYPETAGTPCGSYAATATVRTSALLRAWDNPAVRAVLCGRGGYGCTHLLDSLTPARLRACPKWLVGFSDISALHAALQAASVASLHAPMCRHLAEHGASHPVTQSMMRILTGRSHEIHSAYPHHEGNIAGEAEGTLRGGNLAVIEGLAGTRFDLTAMPGTILFIEDVAEPIYKVERMLWRMHHAGCFDAANPNFLRGLAVGRFTGWQPSADHDSMYAMMARFLRHTNVSIPVAFGLDCGHVEDNHPLVEGARARLHVGDAGWALTQRF